MEANILILLRKNLNKEKAQNKQVELITPLHKPIRKKNFIT